MKNLYKHAVIVLPGWGDDGLKGLQLACYLANRQAKKHQTEFILMQVGWKTHQEPNEVNHQYRAIAKKIETLLKTHETISILGVSLGGALGMQLSLKFLDKVKSFVNYCGCIQYDEEYLNLIKHEGFKHIVKKLDTTLTNDSRIANVLGKKTMLVSGKRDEVVPLKLQQWPLAAKRVKINHYTHLSASTVGAVHQLSKGENGEIWKWLVIGP